MTLTQRCHATYIFDLKRPQRTGPDCPERYGVQSKNKSCYRVSLYDTDNLSAPTLSVRSAIHTGCPKTRYQRQRPDSECSRRYQKNSPRTCYQNVHKTKYYTIKKMFHVVSLQYVEQNTVQNESTRVILKKIIQCSEAQALLENKYLCTSYHSIALILQVFHQPPYIHQNTL